MTYPFAKEYPQEQARVEARLSKMRAGQSHWFETTEFLRAFTRLEGPYDSLFGPSVPPWRVFEREWGSTLEAIQDGYGTVRVRHWHEWREIVEGRVVPESYPSGVWSGENDAYEDSSRVEERTVRRLYDRRTNEPVPGAVDEEL